MTKFEDLTWEASSEPGWTRHWSHESHIPDYTPVRERLAALLKAGRADDVVALGDELPSLWKGGQLFPASVWSNVADKLLKLVPPVPEGRPGSKADADSYSTRYTREKIMCAAFDALARAGRKTGMRIRRDPKRTC